MAIRFLNTATFTSNVGIGVTSNSAGDTNNGVPKLQVGTTTAVLGEFPLAARFTTNSDAGDNSGVSVLINSGNDRGLMISAGRQSGNVAKVTLNLVENSGTELSGITILQNGSGGTSANVGIGTVDPTQKLQVDGRVYIEQQGTNWNETTPGLARGALHFDPAGDGANNTGNAITFGASDTPGSPNQGSNAQAGIYTRTDDSFGTKMYFATTDSYSSGSKTAMMIDSTGVTSFTSTPIVLTRTTGDNTTRAASTAFVTAALGSLPTPFEFNTTTTTGIQSVQASGNTNAATGASSIAMGLLAEASGSASTAMGFRTEASATKSTAMGGETTASGDYSTAMGFQTTASGYASTAMGRLTTPTGQYSTAMGFQTTASGNFSIAMGYQTTASGINSTAIGGSTTASGIASTAISSNTTASGFASVAIGQYNVLNTSDNAFAFAATNTAFSIGNGTGSSSRSDAFKVLFNGNTTIDGNTYIGTAGTPNGTSIYGSAFTSSSNGRMILRLASDSTANRSMVIFYNPNGDVGSINTNGSSTAYTTSSDYRLKEDLKDFNGLEMVSNISVYNYKWKVDETRSYGVMAHELQEVLPDAVSGEKDAEEMQGVDYSKIVPLLIKSIQELTAKVERLEAK